MGNSRKALLALLALPSLSSFVRGSPIQLDARAIVVARNTCAKTTYTTIIPSPGASPTPVTRQLQPVYSYVPEYVLCDVATPTNCESIYSTTYYNWLSTAVPCYSGLCTITDLAQSVTVSASSSYYIATATCQTSGKCVYSDTTTYVSEPTSFPYVETVSNYYACPYSKYNQFHSGQSAGIGSLGLDVYSCSNGVCTISPIAMVYAVNVVIIHVVYPVYINTYITSNTVIIINGGLSIDVNNAPTSISKPFEATSTEKLTVTITTEKSISEAVTVTKTTSVANSNTASIYTASSYTPSSYTPSSYTASSSAASSSAATNTIRRVFVLQANIGVNSENPATDLSFLSFQNGIGMLVNSSSQATIFHTNARNYIIDNAGHYVYATAGDSTNSVGQLQTEPVGPEPLRCSFIDTVLSCGSRTFGVNLIQYCATPNGTLKSIYKDDAIVPADCKPITITRADLTGGNECLGISTAAVGSGCGGISISEPAPSKTLGTSSSNTASSLSRNNPSGTVSTSSTGRNNGPTTSGTTSGGASSTSNLGVDSSSTISGRPVSTSDINGDSGSTTSDRNDAVLTTTNPFATSSTSNIGGSSGSAISGGPVLTSNLSGSSGSTTSGRNDAVSTTTNPNEVSSTSNIDGSSRSTISERPVSTSNLSGSGSTTSGRNEAGSTTTNPFETSSTSNIGGSSGSTISGGPVSTSNLSGSSGSTTSGRNDAVSTTSPASFTSNSSKTPGSTTSDSPSSTGPGGTSHTTTIDGNGASSTSNTGGALPTSNSSKTNGLTTSDNHSSTKTGGNSDTITTDVAGASSTSRSNASGSSTTSGDTRGLSSNDASSTFPISRSSTTLATSGTITTDGAGASSTSKSSVKGSSTTSSDTRGLSSSDTSSTFSVTRPSTTLATSGTSNTGTSNTGTLTSSSGLPSSTGLCIGFSGVLNQVCVNIGGDPCTTEGIVKVDPTLQAQVISLCPLNIAPAVEECLEGVQTNPLTTLGDCLNGILTLSNNANDDLCLNLGLPLGLTIPGMDSNALIANYRALCIATNGQQCKDSSIANLQTSAQQQLVVNLCLDNLSPALETCLAGERNIVDLGSLTTNLGDCINGVLSLGNSANTACQGLDTTLAALCFANGGSSPCQNASAFASVDTTLQNQLVTLCSANLLPAIQDCVQGTLTASSLTTLSQCLTGLVSLGNADGSTLCSPLGDASLIALCLADNNGTPCSDASVLNIGSDLQGSLLTVCGSVGQLSSALEICIDGTLTNGLTTLENCIAGLANIKTSPNAVCGNLTGTLGALCIADGGEICTETGIVNVDTSFQTDLITLCPNNISPNVEACLTGTSGTDALTSLGNCLDGLLNIGSGSCANSAGNPQLLALCLSNNSTDPCSEEGIVTIDTSLQADLIKLCPNNISPSVSACLAGSQSTGTVVTSLSDCLNGIIQVGTSGCSNTSEDPQLIALCFANNGTDPCSEAGIVNIDTSLQTNVITLCPNNISPNVAACLSGTQGTGALTTSLGDCLNGILQVGAAGCTNSVGNSQVLALCFANGTDYCTDAGIVNVDTSLQANIITLCPNNISPVVSACLSGTSGTGAFTNLGDCLDGILAVGAANCASNQTDPQLIALCLANKGQDPCDAASLINIGTTQQNNLVEICLNQLSTAVNTCLSGAVDLGTCLAGIVNLGGDTIATSKCSSFLGLGDNDPTGILGAQCFTNNGEDVCSAAYISSLGVAGVVQGLLCSVNNLLS